MPSPDQAAPVLVQVREMYKSFRHGTRTLEVLRGVNLTLRAREMVTIIGASGAGKSTLLHCLGTLDLPTSGEILFYPPEGGTPTDITRLPPPDLAEFRNRRIGFVFQFHHLLPEFSALENVTMPALIARVPPGKARKQAAEMLDAVGMSHRLDHRPGELSGGNLDTRTSAEVHELLFRLNQEHDLTMLIVTHNMELAQQMPRVVRMADGRILEGDGRDAESEQ
jgi:lipoprotein-releasing system ATP-binding protein